MQPDTKLRDPETSNLPATKTLRSQQNYSAFVSYLRQEPRRTTYRNRRVRDLLIHLAPSFRLFIARQWAEEEQFGHVFVWVPILLGVGSILWLQAATDPPIAGIGLGIVIFSVAVMALSKNRRSGWYICLSVLLVIIGMLVAAIQSGRVNTVILDTSVTTHVTAQVLDRERMTSSQWRYTLKLLSTSDPVVKRQPEKIVLAGRSKDRPADLGEIITGLARLSPPSGPALPRLNDFARDAYFAGFGAVGYFYGAPAKVEYPANRIHALDQLTSIDRWLNETRAYIGTRIQSILPGDTGAFATSMVTDERRAISKETIEALRLSGLAHIVAISGLNMALASGIFFFGIRSALSLAAGIAQRVDVKKIAAGGALLALTAYYLISGNAVSAQRAFVMMAIILVAVLLGKPSISLRNVALSAIVILIWTPSAVLGPSFQMSFAATVALVAGYHVWKGVPQLYNPLSGFISFRYVRPMLHFFGAILLTSAIGGASTAIFSAEHFHQLSVLGLPANLIAMPVVSFIVMPFGVVAMLLMPFGLDEIPLRIMGLGLDITIRTAKYVASWGGNIVTGRLDPWFIPISSAALIVMCIMRSRLRLVGVVVFAAVVLAQRFSTAEPLPDLIVYEDASLVATIGDQTFNLTVEKPPDFLFTQWQTGLQIEHFEKPASVPPFPLAIWKPGEKRQNLTFQQKDQITSAMLAAFGDDRQGRFTCAARQWCATSVRDVANVVIIYNSQMAGAACDVADLIILAVSSGLQTCRSRALVITKANLRKRGSLEISFPKKVDKDMSHEDYISDITINGAMDGVLRPWTKHRFYQWRTDTFDPPFGVDQNQL